MTTPLTSGRLDGLVITPVVAASGNVSFLDLKVRDLPGLVITLEVDAGRELHHALGVVLAGGKSRAAIWARLVRDEFGMNKMDLRTGLALVELPANCSVDGDHGTMRSMIDDLIAMLERPIQENYRVYSDDDAKRHGEIKQWLAENPL